MPMAKSQDYTEKRNTILRQVQRAELKTKQFPGTGANSPLTPEWPQHWTMAGPICRKGQTTDPILSNDLQRDP